METKLKEYYENRHLHLEIYLIRIKNIINLKCMFEGYQSLLSLPDISKFNTSNVTNLNTINNCSVGID